MADQTPLWRAAVRPRMLGLLVLLLAAAAACARLGVWQLERAEIRGASSAAREAEQVLTADPVPLADVLVPGQTFTGEMVARKVEVTGAFDDARTLLVTGRAHDGRTDGYLVLTPLLVETGEGTAALPVVRGWSAQEDVAAAPAGEVTVVGWLQAGEEAGTAPVDGRTDAISPAQLVATWGTRVHTGYLVTQATDPADTAGLEMLDPPRKAGGGLNIQNLAYAAQWWIFGIFAVGLWWRLVRDEAAGPPPMLADGPAGPGGPPSDDDGDDGGPAESPAAPSPVAADEDRADADGGPSPDGRSVTVG